MSFCGHNYEGNNEDDDEGDAIWYGHSVWTLT